MPASPKVGELATHRRSDIPQAMRIAILAIIIPMLIGGSLPASAAGKLDVASEAKLQKWFNYLSRVDEPAHFGALVAEAARFHVGSPYFHEPQPNTEPKSIDITLESHQCVSLVEQSIAVATCFLKGETTSSCFIEGVERLRYRNGRFSGYTSRLHYFVDWYWDNQRRGNLASLSTIHKFRPWRRTFNVMSSRKNRYPLLRDNKTLANIKAVEARLSDTPFDVIPKGQVEGAMPKFEHGDIVGIVTHHAGLAVTHVGIAFKAPDGTMRLLHASSFHKRVVITVEDIADYVARESKRQGLMVTRPLPLNF